MAITIKSYNFSGLTARVLSVYNPITFAVDSTLRTRAGYSYVADVYYSGTTTTGQTLVTRLESTPNLYNFYGVFDVHRPLESVITSDKNYNISRITDATNSYNNFAIKFGDKFSTTNTFTSVEQRASGPNVGKLVLNLAAPHALTVGDRVWIDKDYKGVDSSYDGNCRVLELQSTTKIVVSRNYGTGTTAQTGDVIEGTNFWDTFYQEGKVGLACSLNPNVQIGDTIVVDKDLKSLNPSYDGQWTVIDISEYLGDTVIHTNIPWGQSSSTESGMTYIKGSKVLSGLTTSLEYSWVMNSVNDYDDNKSYGQSKDFIPYALTGTTSKFLTNGVATQSVLSNDYFTFSFLSHNSFLSKPTQIRTVINFTSGTTRTYDQYLGSLYSSSSTNRGALRLDVGVGPANINSAIGLGYLSGSSVDYSTVSSISVYAYASGSSAQVSQTYTLGIDNDCSNYDTFRFMWLNRLGGFDYYNFRKRSDTTYSIEKDTYQRKLGDFQGDAYGYNIGARGVIINNVNIEELVSVNSNWITEDESAWLFELFQSPEVYLIDGANIYPIVVINDSYTVGKRENIKLINLKVDFKYAYKKFAQRG
jgi:hypothetical protein